MKIENAVVLITGANRGLGLAFAEVPHQPVVALLARELRAEIGEGADEDEVGHGFGVTDGERAQDRGTREVDQIVVGWEGVAAAGSVAMGEGGGDDEEYREGEVEDGAKQAAGPAGQRHRRRA